MQTLTEKIIQQGWADRIMADSQLGRIVGGSQQRRYGLVNRAMKSGELIRLQRGIYTLDNQFRNVPLHPFALAQIMIPGSYVSLETALATHSWIPEAVYTTASISPHSKTKQYEHEQFGVFTFNPLAVEKGHFLEMISRQQMDKQTWLVARPLRALMDMVYLRKTEWMGMDWLIEGMRIDMEYLRTITSAEIRTLKLVYKNKRTRQFLEELARELGND